MTRELIHCSSLPENYVDFKDVDWSQIETCYQELADFDLTSDSFEAWMSSWTKLHSLISETYARMYVDTAIDTSNSEAEENFQDFVNNIYLRSQPFETRLKQLLVDSGICPEGFDRPLENIKADIALFAEENLPLKAESERLSNEYARIIGAQTVEWEGEKKTIQAMKPVLQESDRKKREKAWNLIAERQLEDRDQLNEIWVKFLDLRTKLAENSGKPGYRDYRWQELRRFDYTPQDCRKFHFAIHSVVVPAAQKIYQRRAQRLGLEVLKPWDVDAEPAHEEKLKPFENVNELKSVANNIFDKVAPELGDQFGTMIEENLLDLDNREGKAPGGFCTYYPVAKRPFVFMNAVGLQDDVRTLLHEAGHSFHDFALGKWHLQWEYGTEFAEVASMAMELLASPYLAKEQGGYYSERDAARARINHLENNILFWPYMAVVDSFQQWAYENPDLARDASACDRTWADLWGKFMVGIDYTDLESVMQTGWHRKLHIFQYPLYYVEYGLAQLGAVQVWANALKNQTQAVTDYRKALSLGAQPLPLLFETAGAKFAFDAETLTNAVKLMEDTISELEEAL